MRKLTGMGACVTLAVLLTSCGEQNKAKMQDVAKNTAKGKLDDARKEAAKSAQEAGKAADSAGKAAQEAGKAAQEAGIKAGEAGGQALADAQAKISETAKTASEALEGQFSKAAEQASESLKSVKGAPGVVDKIGEVFPSLQQTLAGIKDKASAENALPKLEQLDGTVSKLAGQFGSLPEGAKKTIGGLVQKGTTALQPLVDNVLALPQAQAIRPKVEAIMTKLKNLNG